MDRGAWWATVHGVVRARHDLATKLPPFNYNSIYYMLYTCNRAVYYTSGARDTKKNLFSHYLRNNFEGL